MNFIKKNLSNILFFGFVIFLFTPFGLPVRAFLIKSVSFVTTRVLNLEIEEKERVKINNYDWKLIDDQGNSVNFNQFKNKVVLVNFWATWCPPCVAEMPSFQSLYNDYKDDVVFAFVAKDMKERVKKFLKDKDYDLPVYFQETYEPKELQSTALPTTFVIDKSGEIIIKKTGAVDWNSDKVKKLLDKLIQR